MAPRRFLAFGLCCSGMLLVLSGMGTGLYADFCTPSDPYYPAICHPAHQVPPEAESGGLPEGCQSSYYFWCVPTEGGSCGSTQGYGHVTPGFCEHYLAESNSQSCRESAVATAVLLHYHVSECQFYEGVCTCMWVTGDYPPVSIPVCDCQ